MLLNEAGQVLLGRRKHAENGPGEFAMPGGQIEYGESFEAAMRRELAEECGDHLRIEGLRKISVINWRRPGRDQWLGFGGFARLVEGEPKQMEPYKMGAWGWYELDALPRPLYEPSAWNIEAYQTGKVWFDSDD